MQKSYFFLDNIINQDFPLKLQPLEHKRVRPLCTLACIYSHLCIYVYLFILKGNLLVADLFTIRSGFSVPFQV